MKVEFKPIAARVLPYAFVCFSCWLLISGQISDDAFLWIFLGFALVSYFSRRKAENSSEKSSKE
ncbi:MAG: hypothetical protein NW237_09125 [Cyanobacteriota bacterium]|nr:hypothetical protein [Cyanobacteriota bacterium]